ncbi:TerB family tellurite resistance protein [Mucilaginibacter aquaedulcis]|uniref:TerB family tellurite resistance protein n=1 Tax=Mucilaginibacter aquaedulcis TaxID=1187081 RepID=UPI0025B29562|nr:TerB family tellurite resistance protein [Mucilaginibacter aquaedulcis]MDN3548973.1 TerB family tellurite resistance protein [Mucilaginibacter aquaedulcis]
MKRFITMVIFLGLAAGVPLSSRAQSVADVLKQLALDYQKLAGLKNILGQLQTGYSVLSKGYGAVKDAAKGNFSLQEVFLDGLYLVSPAVRRYPRIKDIILDQARLVGECREASGLFRSGQQLPPDEQAYMTAVYGNLISRSLKNLDDLSMIVTDKQLRMSDAERLSAIDQLYRESRDQLSYLRKFDDQAARVSRQRAQDNAERQSVGSIYGLTH